MPLPFLSSHSLKPARFTRRDLLLGSGALVVLAITTGLHRVPDQDASSLDDFMLVSQTLSGQPLDRRAGLDCFSHLYRTDARFVDRVQTLAWLVRRHPGLSGAGLVGLLDADHHVELRATLGRLVDAWTAQTGTTPALADARSLIEHPSGTAQPSS
ncbi:sorbitol dehydrogenase family protein [Ralstonia sp. A12]|uniref:sorbitol dehydrogenase family protein n=1 Tax=Ralstonia sp. A12 TaxID=1217052 RepID=UPI001E2A13D2|nr:sorbitol dehydrogenase family protein [Ralstonia sp. A12]